MLDDSRQQKLAQAMRTWREVWLACALAAAAAAARVDGGRGSSERAQSRHPGGVAMELDDEEDDEMDCASSNMSRSTLTNSGTKGIIDGWAKEQDAKVDFRSSKPGDALEEERMAALEMDWEIEVMNEEKKESTQDTRMILTGTCDNDDAELEGDEVEWKESQLEEEEDVGEEKVQQ
jgi:hypothetical protein